MSLPVTSLKQWTLAAFPAIFLVVGSALSIYIAAFASPRNVPLIAGVAWNSQLQTGVEHRHRKFLEGPPYASVKDPFVLPDKMKLPVGEEILPELKLTMIIIDKRHKVCKLNGRLYREGDNGPDFQVKQIDEEKVFVERMGEGQWLFLIQDS